VTPESLLSFFTSFQYPAPTLTTIYFPCYFDYLYALWILFHFYCCDQSNLFLTF